MLRSLRRESLRATIRNRASASEQCQACCNESDGTQDDGSHTNRVRKTYLATQDAYTPPFSWSRESINFKSSDVKRTRKQVFALLNQTSMTSARKNSLARAGRVEDMTTDLSSLGPDRLIDRFRFLD